MREYECLYILSPTLGEEEVTAVSDKMNQLITDSGGEILLTNPWGKRRLAYEIKHHKEGYYIQIRFNSEKDIPSELDRAMRYTETILRHMIVTADKLDPATPGEAPEQLPESGFEPEPRGYRPDRYASAEQSPVAEETVETDIPAAEAAEEAAPTLDEAVAETETIAAEEPAPTEEAPDAEGPASEEVAEPKADA